MTPTDPRRSDGVGVNDPIELQDDNGHSMTNGWLWNGAVRLEGKEPHWFEFVPDSDAVAVSRALAAAVTWVTGQEEVKG